MIPVLILTWTQGCCGQANLLPNPGFEEPLTAWKAWGRDGEQVVRDEAVAHSGQASVRIPGGRAAPPIAWRAS